MDQFKRLITHVIKKYNIETTAKKNTTALAWYFNEWSYDYF